MDDAEDIIEELDDVIGLSLPIIVEECVIIGEEVLDVDDEDEAGVDELHAARVRASTRPPPMGAMRAGDDVNAVRAWVWASP